MVCIIMVYIIILFTPHSPHQELSHTESLPPQKSTFCSPTCMDSPPGHNSSLCSVIDPSGWILIGVPLGTRRALFLEFYRAASELRTVSQLHAGSLSVRANSHRLEKEICTVPQVLNPTAKKREFFSFWVIFWEEKKKKKELSMNHCYLHPKYQRRWTKSTNPCLCVSSQTTHSWHRVCSPQITSRSHSYCCQ